MESRCFHMLFYCKENLNYSKGQIQYISRENGWNRKYSTVTEPGKIQLFGG